MKSLFVCFSLFLTTISDFSNNDSIFTELFLTCSLYGTTFHFSFVFNQNHFQPITFHFFFRYFVLYFSSFCSFTFFSPTFLSTIFFLSFQTYFIPLYIFSYLGLRSSFLLIIFKCSFFLSGNSFATYLYFSLFPSLVNLFPSYRSIDEHSIKAERKLPNSFIDFFF